MITPMNIFSLNRYIFGFKFLIKMKNKIEVDLFNWYYIPQKFCGN